MPAKLSEAFRLPISEAMNSGGNIQRGNAGGLDPQAQWGYSGARQVGGNASAGAMNYQPTPPMRPPPGYQSVGASQHAPVTGYTPPNQGYTAPNQMLQAWAAQAGLPQVSPEFANTLLFIALGVFFLLLLDMIVKRAKG